MMAGILGAALSFANGIYTNVSAQRRQQQAQDFNKQLAELQNQYNVAQWQRENSYNRPAAQMQRYKDAGLNPNLIYDTQNFAAASPVMQSSLAPAQAAPTSPILDPSAMLLGAQVENVKADTQLKQAQEQKELKDTSYLNAQIDKTIAEQTNLLQLTTTEFQKGLEIAMRNFANGYRPDRFVVDGRTIYDNSQFGREFYEQLDRTHNLINSVAQQYDIDRYHFKYLQECFESILRADKAAAESAAWEALGRGKFNEAIASDADMNMVYQIIMHLTQPATQLFGSAMKLFGR